MSVDLETKAMQQLPNRGVMVLAAFKIYLELLESRSKGSSETLISNRKLVEAMSLPPAVLQPVSTTCLPIALSM